MRPHFHINQLIALKLKSNSNATKSNSPFVAKIVRKKSEIFPKNVFSSNWSLFTRHVHRDKLN